MDCLERIRYLLKEREWSIYKLAQAADLPQSTLSNLFARNNTPTIPTLERICDALGITLAEFFAEEPAPDPEEALDRQMEGAWKQLAPAQKKLILDLIRQWK